MAPSRGPDPIRRLYWNGGAAGPDGWSTDGTSPEELVGEGLSHETGSYEFAYVGPALGRVASWQVPDVLREFHRVLRVGGGIRVAAIDFDAAVAAYLVDDRDFFWNHWSDELVAGVTSVLLEGGEARCLFTAALVEELLVQAGFVNARPTHVGEGDPTTDADPAAASHGHLCFTDADRAQDGETDNELSAPTAVHLCWAAADCSQIDVIWSGPADIAAEVRFRDDSGGGQWVQSPVSGLPTIDGLAGPHVFRSTCGPLTPGRRYSYEITARSALRDAITVPGTFSSLPSFSEPLRFAFVADTGLAGRGDGLADAAPRVLSEIAALDPHFVLGGGDYAYASSDSRLQGGTGAVRAWLDQISPLASRVPFMVQYGNHEVHLGERHRDWAPHFSPLPTHQTRSFSFDAANTHVVGFYAPTERISPAEVAWLCADLEDARARGCVWVVVFQHQPLYSHGRSHPSGPDVRLALGDVLQRYRVDLHLSAHDQSFERTYPLVFDGPTTTIASKARDTYTQGDGTVLAKVSPGGKRSDRGKDFSRLQARPEINAASSDTRHHFSVVRATPHRLEMSTYGLGDASADLEIVDHLTIEARP